MQVELQLTVEPWTHYNWYTFGFLLLIHLGFYWEGTWSLYVDDFHLETFHDCIEQEAILHLNFELPNM